LILIFNNINLILIMSQLIIPLCKSFEKEKCKSRLNLYVEKSVDREKAIVETIACPFYENGNCKVNGMLEIYTKVYFYKLPVYEEKK